MKTHHLKPYDIIRVTDILLLGKLEVYMSQEQMYQLYVKLRRYVRKTSKDCR